jgi:hypothetical protein
VQCRSPTLCSKDRILRHILVAVLGHRIRRRHPRSPNHTDPRYQTHIQTPFLPPPHHHPERHTPRHLTFPTPQLPPAISPLRPTSRIPWLPITSNMDSFNFLTTSTNTAYTSGHPPVPTTISNPLPARKLATHSRLLLSTMAVSATRRQSPIPPNFPNTLRMTRL